uniref:Uncharacterized protein n=1 Tax=Anguilla anguilla TaxID=7936 RepID=A0A0E9U5Y9_ANGAN
MFRSSKVIVMSVRYNALSILLHVHT